MPYAFERKLIPQSLDRRRKLSDAQKDEIASRYKAGGVSMSKLAVEYGVSKKLILLIVNPDAMERNKKHITEHWRDYYDTAKNTAMRREFRANKKELEARGQLLNAADCPGVPDGLIADIQPKEQEMAIPNYLKDVPIRCPRQDKVREVANILIHLQRYGASNAMVDVITTKRGNEICTTKFICIMEHDDFTAKKSHAKLVEAAADICGNRKGIIRLNVASCTGNKVYTVDFPPVTGRPPKTDK